MLKGILVAAILSVSAVVFAVPAAGEIISQVGAPPVSFTWDLEVDLTPWGYIEFSQVPFVPVDVGKGDYGAEGNQSQASTEKLSEREALLRVLQQKVPCKWDWDCKKLEREMPLIPLDKKICVGEYKYFDGRTDPILPRDPSYTLELIGKRYTDYLQIGYKFTFKCATGEDGQKYCVPDKVNYDAGLIKCQYGCLVTPVEKNGKVYSNFCMCFPGYVKGKKLFCDPSRGPHVYYELLDWTCEESVEIAGYCEEGAECHMVSKDKAECRPLSAQEFLKRKGIDITTGNEEGEERYTFLFPGNIDSKPIEVAFIKDGRVITERPISDLTAWEYISKYGPIDTVMAYEFALRTGLVEEVEHIIRSESALTILRNMAKAASINETPYRFW